MGRKKRGAAEGGSGGAAVGEGGPPPMGYPSHPTNAAVANGNDPSKKPKTGETFLVKKYRAEKHYPAMEAFVRYTKTHRMLDATYVRWFQGGTNEKPYVFSTRVGGQDLSWGRGKTREAAMDCACRATFALFNAHGYKNFPLDDDCLTDLPVDAPPPPPPPPPPPLPPPGGMGGPHYGMAPPGYPPGGTSAMPPYAPHAPYNLPPPPLPPGGLPPLPPPGSSAYPPPPVPPPPLPGSSAAVAYPAVADFVIPQPQVQTHAPVATALSAPHLTGAAATAQFHQGGESAAAGGGGATSTKPFSVTMMAAPTAAKKSSIAQLKGGLQLVFDPGMEGVEEESMEEMRAKLPRYVRGVGTVQ